MAQTAARVAELQDRITRTEVRLAEYAAPPPGQSEIATAEVDAAFARFDNVREQLSPREQNQHLALLSDRIEFDATQNRLAIRFDATAITTLAQEAAA